MEIDKSRNMITTTSTTSSLASFGKNNLGDNIYPMSTIKLPSTCDHQESNEISEMTKDFSVCAKSFGHSVKAKSISDLVCGQTTALPEIYGEDESAKDCL